MDSPGEVGSFTYLSFEGHIGNHFQKYSSSYETEAVQFYRSNRKKVWPSLTYTVKQRTDLTIAFRVGVDWNLFCALVFFNGNYAQIPERAKETDQHI